MPNAKLRFGASASQSAATIFFSFERRTAKLEDRVVFPAPPFPESC